MIFVFFCSLTSLLFFYFWSFSRVFCVFRLVSCVCEWCVSLVLEQSLLLSLLLLQMRCDLLRYAVLGRLLFFPCWWDAASDAQPKTSSLFDHECVLLPILASFRIHVEEESLRHVART